MIRKQFLLSICMLMLTAFAIAQAKPFTLSGKIRGKTDGYIYLSYSDGEGKRKTDSAAIQNGTFIFKGKLTGPQLVYLNGDPGNKSSDNPNATSLFIEPANMKADLKYNSFKEIKLTGSVTQNEYAKLQAKREKVQKRWKVIMDTLSAVNKRSNVEYQEMKAWVLRPYNAEMAEIDKDFIKAYPASYVTPYVLFFAGRGIPQDSAKKIFARFPEGVKKSIYGQMLAEKWEKQKIGVPGTMAANFSAKDINEVPLSLSDYKGKYVLLDFWASWCVPCRKGNPHLLKLYAQYKDKGFEIIGVSDDDSKQDAWRNAVEKDGIGVWKHVLRGLDPERTKKGDYKNHPNEISSGKYNISSLPTKVLIDPTGKIIGRYGGEVGEDDEAMDKKLKEIFGT